MCFNHLNIFFNNNTLQWERSMLVQRSGVSLLLRLNGWTIALKEDVRESFADVLVD
jgi:hypothetical protein